MRIPIYDPKIWYNPHPERLYLYSIYHWPFSDVEKRWLLLSDVYSHTYARYVEKSRWIEAEPVIKGSDYQEVYENHFGCKL